MSFVASDAEHWLGSRDLSDTRAGLDAELFQVLSKAVEELGVEWSTSEDAIRRPPRQ